MRDLELIRSEVRSPIIVLMDESNVLSQIKILIQKIRSLFMNIPGFMLVVSGTEELFPAMNEVLSPISRDFKRFEVGRFRSRDEARDCVTKPLITIGVHDPESVVDRETMNDLISPEGLTAANPYQIQLVCHFLFRNAQGREPLRMELNLDVLDDVLDEIEGGEDVRSSRTIEALRTLPDQDPRRLSELCRCNGRATLDQLSHIQHVLFGRSEEHRIVMENDLDTFQDLGLIENHGGKIGFAGDERETIYAKYFARAKGIRSLVSSLDPADYFAILLQRRLAGSNSWKVLGTPLATIEEIEVGEEIVHQIAHALVTGVDSEQIINRGNRWVIRGMITEIYYDMVRLRDANEGSIALASITARSPWLNRQLTFSVGEGGNDEKVAFDERLETVASRARDVGIEIAWRTDTYDIPDQTILFERIASADNVLLRRSLASVHYFMTMRAYKRGDREAVAVHGDWSYRLDPDPPSFEQRNNLAYVFLLDRKLLPAESLLQAEDGKSRSDVTPGLIDYNRGVLRLMQDDASSARYCFEASVDAARQLDAEERLVSCLIFPEFDGHDLMFPERMDPDLLAMAQLALELTQHLSDGQVAEVVGGHLNETAGATGVEIAQEVDAGIREEPG